MSEPRGTSELPSVALSVLDLLLVSETQTAADSLASTQAVARTAEDLGFTRYWIGEHHNESTIASAAGPLVIAAVGGVTTRLRIGSGPVHLPNYSPYVIAEQFGTLNALFGDRVDIGVGRSAPDDPRVAAALRGGPAASEQPFDARFDELVSYLRGAPPASDADPRPVRAYPHYATRPPLWIQAATLAAAEFAAERGFPLTFLDYFKPDLTEDALRLYREKFRPSEYADQPYVALVANVVCAADDEQAQWLAAPGVLATADLQTGVHADAMPTPERAAAHNWSGPQAEFRSRYFARSAIGGPALVRERLAELLDRTKADELMAVNTVTGTAARTESLTRLRDLFLDAR